MADDLSKMLDAMMRQLGVPDMHRGVVLGVVGSVTNGATDSVRERAEEIWRRSTDKVAEDAEAEQHSKAADKKIDVWEKGYAKGYAAGLRETGRREVACADANGYPLSVGDQVMKTSGDYKFPGRVVTVFKKVDEETVRVVVESTSEGTQGVLHIFTPSQVAKVFPITL